MTTTPAMPEHTIGKHDHPEPHTMCWSDLELAAIKRYAETYTLATLQAQPAAESTGAPGAVQTLIEALKADQDYAWAWHCNVAMASVDEGMGHYESNKAAARFMYTLANIDTTTHPGFPPAPAQPAAVSDAAVDLVGNELARKHAVYLSRETVQDLLSRAIPAPAAQAVPMTRQQLREEFHKRTRCILGGDIHLAERVAAVVEAFHGIGITAQATREPQT